MPPSKFERFHEFLRRLELAPAASSQEDAFRLISETLNQVEDEVTDIPHAPGNWQSDGRMYPPQSDQARTVPGRTDLIRYRSRGHNTYIGSNGAIEIYDLSGACLFQKVGSDGQGI